MPAVPTISTFTGRYFTGTCTSSSTNLIWMESGAVSTASTATFTTSSTVPAWYSIDSAGGIYLPTGTGSITSSPGQWIYYNTAEYEPPDPEQQARWQREREKERWHSVHRAKNSIKRALKLIDNVGFGPDVRMFLGGNEIEVFHPDSPFKFVMTQREGSFIDLTASPGYSTPYVLELYTKSDVFVANLCVYMERTPVLDQLLAVAMYIRTGDEQEILQKANWLTLTKDQELRDILALECPALATKLRPTNRFSGEAIPSGIYINNHGDNPISVRATI